MKSPATPAISTPSASATAVERDSRLALSLGDRRESSFHNLKLYEPVLLQALYAVTIADKQSSSSVLLSERDYKKKMSSLGMWHPSCPNEKTQINRFLANYDRELDAVAVEYRMPKHQYGRAFVDQSAGLGPMRRILRNTISKGLLRDFDMSNAHPNILRQICQYNNIPCPMLTELCEKRDEWLYRVMAHYNVDRTAAKNLFIRLCYGGSAGKWAEENNRDRNNHPGFVWAFRNELKQVTEVVKKANPTLYECARKKNMDTPKLTKKQQAKRAETKTEKEIEEDEEHDAVSTMLSLYGQEHERRILEAVFFYIHDHTNMMNYKDKKFAVYTFDGMMLLAELVDQFGGNEAVLALLREKTIELTGFDMEWELKEPAPEEIFDVSPYMEEALRCVEGIAEFVADAMEVYEQVIGEDNAASKLLKKLFPNDYMYAVDPENTEKGTWYCWRNGKWSSNRRAMGCAIQDDLKAHWQGIMDKKWARFSTPVFGDEPTKDEANYNEKMLWFRVNKALCKRIRALEKNHGKKELIDNAADRLERYDVEFDLKRDLFGCNNGVLDLKEECFRKARYDDYVTMSCGYDFVPCIPGLKVEWELSGKEKPEGEESPYYVMTEEDVPVQFKEARAYLEETYRKIMPDPQERELLWATMASGINGRCIEKFFNWSGKGGNGKGVTSEFICRVLGNYAVSVSRKLFSHSSDNPAAPNPELAKINKKRFIIAREIDLTHPFKNSNIKELTGGGALSARMCGSNNTEVNNMGTYITESNGNPPLETPPGDAEIRRFVDMLFPSKFVRGITEDDPANNIYVQDSNMKTKMIENENCRVAMLNMLFMHALKHKQIGYSFDDITPESVRTRTMAYMQKSFDIHNIFQSRFEKYDENNKGRYVIDNDWTLSKIASYIKRTPDFMLLNKLKQKELTAKGAIENFFLTNIEYSHLVKSDSHTKKVTLMGYRLKPEDTDDNHQPTEQQFDASKPITN